MSTPSRSRPLLRVISGVFFALLLGVIGMSFAHPAAADDAASPTVAIKDYAFGPATLTVPVGTTLTWTNNDTTEHSTTSVDGLWDSQKIVPGASYSVTFTTPGTYAYYCKYHIFMKGVVTVADDGTTVPTAADTDGGAAATGNP